MLLVRNEVVSLAKLKETKYLKYIINLVIAAVILLAIVYMPFDIGLEKEAVNYLAILAAMVFMLISGVFDEHVVILATLAMCVLLKVASFSTIFSAYSGTTMWMVLSILPITVVIQKSGLMNRIALLLLKLFPASYKWQLFSLALSSMVVSPLIPSTTAKSSLLASLTASVAEKMKLEKKMFPLSVRFLKGKTALGYPVTAPRNRENAESIVEIKRYIGIFGRHDASLAVADGVHAHRDGVRRGTARYAYRQARSDAHNDFRRRRADRRGA